LESVHEDLWIDPMSGGTEVFTDLIGGVPIVPVYAGVTGKRCLGMDVESYDDSGMPVRGAPGELVIRQPFPSMPARFMNDPDFSVYRATYLNMFDGVWRHGDFVEIGVDGYCTVRGRSDSTIKRRGVRLGTGEIYEVVESLPFVADSLAIGTEDSSGETLFILYVSPKSGHLGEEEKTMIRNALRERLSPRYVPDHIIEVSSIPRTLSGKKIEVPVKRILVGMPPERAVDVSSLSNPEAFWEIVNITREVLRKESSMN
jgi:acetoacetyl-CoA synthetase